MTRPEVDKIFEDWILPHLKRQLNKTMTQQDKTKDSLDESLEELKSRFWKGKDETKYWVYDEKLKEETNFLLQAIIKEYKSLVEELDILRTEHANTARHGDNPDSAYDRMDNSLKQKIINAESKLK